MEKKLKNWETALIVGLLMGVLSSPADAAFQPLSRWREGEQTIRYQVSLFPFGFAEAAQPVIAQAACQEREEMELRFWVLDWLEGLCS